MSTEVVEVAICKINSIGPPIIRGLHLVMYHTKQADVSNIYILEVHCMYLTVKEEDKVAVKIRGLPYQVRYEEIADFFRDHRYIEKSSILGVGADGRKNGFGSILFEDQETA